MINVGSHWSRMEFSLLKNPTCSSLNATKLESTCYSHAAGAPSKIDTMETLKKSGFRGCLQGPASLYLYRIHGKSINYLDQVHLHSPSYSGPFHSIYPE